MTPPWKLRTRSAETASAKERVRVSGGKTPNAMRTGASMLVETIEKAAEQAKWSATQRHRRPWPTGQRRPNQRIAGVKAAQIYIAAIQPTRTLRQGRLSLRYRRGAKSWVK